MRWLKAIAMRILGRGESQSTTPLEQQEATPSVSAKPLRAKSGQPSKDAREQSKPAKSKPKRKASPAQSTTAVASRKPAQKPAQKTSGQRGRPRKTPV